MATIQSVGANRLGTTIDSRLPDSTLSSSCSLSKAGVLRQRFCYVAILNGSWLAVLVRLTPTLSGANAMVVWTWCSDRFAACTRQGKNLAILPDLDGSNPWAAPPSLGGFSVAIGRQVGVLIAVAILGVDQGSRQCGCEDLNKSPCLAYRRGLGIFI